MKPIIAAAFFSFVLGCEAKGQMDQMTIER